MKIVHVEDYFNPAAGYQINELLRINKTKNDEIYLITSKDMSPFHDEVKLEKDKIFEKEFNVKIIRLDSKFKLSTRILLRNLWKVIDGFNPELVFLHGIGDFKDLSLFKKKKPYKIVRDCHMSWIASKNKYAKIYYKMFKIFFSKIINETNKYERIFALGLEEYQYLKALGINDNKIDYLYHGYNDEVIYYNENERKEIRSLYKFDKNDIVISYIGKFNNSKRPDLIIDIVSKLTDKLLNGNLKLLFIGSKDNEYMQLFNEKINKLKGINVIIDDSKSFNELRKYFSASDICIFPKETTLSSIHAQVCGCTVIMENHDSNKERVILNDNLYNIDKLDEATKILRRVIEKKEYLKEKNISILHEIKNREYKKQISKINELL